MTSSTDEAALWLYEFIESVRSGEAGVNPEITQFIETVLATYEESVASRFFEDVLGDRDG